MWCGGKSARRLGWWSVRVGGGRGRWCYGGGTVVHVGELRGHSRVPIGAPLAQADGEGAPSGVTTSLACQLALEKGFELVETVGLPNWHFTSDRLTVWRRRSKPAVPAGR